jgi:hypothetical protein
MGLIVSISAKYCNMAKYDTLQARSALFESLKYAHS